MALTKTTHFVTLTLLVNFFSNFSPFILANHHHHADDISPQNFPWPPTQNTTKADSSFFTYTAARSLVGAAPPTQFTTLNADKTTFPALTGQGVSLSVLQFPPGVVNPPHSHPRSPELLLLLSGALRVGFIDAENKLFNQTLQAGDMFVFPKGMVHYHHNFLIDNTSVAVSAFASASPGLVSIPSNLFNSGIEDAILAQSFKTDVPTIERLKASVAGN
ncbi:OLC1v1004649C1 [Oldenlandia corymbosa var. corymbosa]|uniref:Germin-like protein n=1 Tax=Oldenlandia corymbosa var. corymbosa TaxID=529605 RepID=A0AAV1DCV6_OLDCO|nr:OLC1v1004649C1 [Oldenlandia corymbosa var. corymbosa]